MRRHTCLLANCQTLNVKNIHCYTVIKLCLFSVSSFYFICSSLQKCARSTIFPGIPWFWPFWRCTMYIKTQPEPEVPVSLSRSLLQHLPRYNSFPKVSIMKWFLCKLLVLLCQILVSVTVPSDVLGKPCSETPVSTK